MLKEITIEKPTSPNPFALLTAGSMRWQCPWWTYTSNHPPVLAVCPSGKRDSGGCIQREGTFALSVVGEALRNQTFRCDTCSCRDVDKTAYMFIPRRRIFPPPASLAAARASPASSKADTRPESM